MLARDAENQEETSYWFCTVGEEMMLAIWISQLFSVDGRFQDYQELAGLLV